MEYIWTDYRVNIHFHVNMIHMYILSSVCGNKLHWKREKCIIQVCWCYTTLPMTHLKILWCYYITHVWLRLYCMSGTITIRNYATGLVLGYLEHKCSDLYWCIWEGKSMSICSADFTLLILTSFVFKVLCVFPHQRDSKIWDTNAQRS